MTRLSTYFLHTLKETPGEARIASHRLMLRASLIRQTSAGIYAWLPLGLRVLRKVEVIIREEQERAGAIEMLMPTLQPADLWRRSGRYEDYGREMLRVRDCHDKELIYGPTNEEMVTDIFRAVRSYREVPRTLFHIQWKFRDEIRPRFGVMRGREFLMKDGYSFDIDEAGGRLSYYKMFVAYLRTFARMGLRTVAVAAETGPIGGDLSHEFIVFAKTGESEIFCHRRLLEMPPPEESVDVEACALERIALYAATMDKHDPARFEREVPKDMRVEGRGIEVGHIFFFGDKYSKALDAQVTTSEGGRVFLQCGSYGIGVSRLVGALIEVNHDDKGIIWPLAVAPFEVALVSLGGTASELALEMYGKLQRAGLTVLYDDVEEHAGVKFARQDLIGLPWQLIVGPRDAKEGLVELKERATDQRHRLSGDSAVRFLVEHCSSP